MTDDKKADILYSHVRKLTEISWKGTLHSEKILDIKWGIFLIIGVIMMPTYLYSTNFVINSTFIPFAFFASNIVQAMFALKPRKRENPDLIENMEKFVKDNWEDCLSKAKRDKQIMLLYVKMQKPIESSNQDKAMFLNINFLFFLVGITIFVLEMGFWNRI